MTALLAATSSKLSPEEIGSLAAHCLVLEIETWPKPGLVSHIDAGAHGDMDADLMRRSAKALQPFFIDLAAAGAAGAGMSQLRDIGVKAEHVMLTTTGGVNTHRGAIFGMGLLAAAAGMRTHDRTASPLGRIVATHWGDAILAGPVDPRSHGSQVARHHRAGGARAEAAAGMPSLYTVARPALVQGRGLAGGAEEAARVHACMALIAQVEDSNLLYRGGALGLAFAQAQARGFLARGGVGAADWRTHAASIHHDFVALNLSPGGCADLLAMALFIEGLEP